MHRKLVDGSPILRISQTQEELDFCAQHGIGSDIEVNDVHDINDRYEKVEKARFACDMSSTWPC